jgi:hypothetical protein
MAHVILFEHGQFRGEHKHVFGPEPDLNAQDDNFFNDRVSSLVVLQGNWAVFADSGFQRQYPPILGPGFYPSLPVGINNDDMSSLQPVTTPATVSGQQFDDSGQVILFEHAHFHGRHKHVFVTEPNLNDPNDSFFNDRVSSFAVLAGSWMFFKNSGAQPSSNPYPPVVGPPRQVVEDPLSSAMVGGVTFVESLGIKNDDMSSLRPISRDPTFRGTLMQHLLLFEHANFHGAHKHVFVAEPNLDAPDDNFFNDRVSSIVVLSGQWLFCSDPNFHGLYPPALGPGPGPLPTPGLTPFVGDVGIKNDDMSSLFPT